MRFFSSSGMIYQIGMFSYTFISYIALDIEHLPSHYSLPCGLVAGFLASVTTQPADVIKTRMQIQPKSSNLQHTIATILRDGGIRSMFVGLAPRATRRTLMASFTWAFYEHVSVYE